jgi:hypothetical protein
MIEPD